MDTPDCCAPGSQTMDSDVAARVAAVLKSLADPLRLRMLSLISTTPGGEACVCDIATVADVSQPTVSHHLKVLKDTGVLTAERRGTWVYYRVAPDLAEPVAQLLDGFAPAVVRAGQAEPEGRIGTGAGVDAALTRIATEITGQVRGIGPDLVLHTVRESYAALARTSRAGTDVVALAARFAHQRLEDLRRVAERAVDDPSTGTVSPGVPQVLFVCVANDGRSQIAAALATHYVSDALIVRSAGLRPAPRLAPSVEELLGGLGGGAATRTPAGPLAPAAFPKPLTDDALRAADVVVTLGCGDACPVLPGVRYEDWIVGDPALASRAGVRAIAAHLDRRVRDLLAGLLPSADLPAALFPDAVSSTEQHLLRPVDPAPGRG